MKVSSDRLAFLRGGGVVPGLFFLTLALFVGAVVNYMLRGPSRGALLTIACVLPFAVVWLGVRVLHDRIDSRLEAALGRGLRGSAIIAHDFPDYRFVDVFRAVEAAMGESCTVLDSRHSEELGSIANGTFMGTSGFPDEPARVARAVDASREEYFPTDRFWIKKDGDTGIVVRIRHIEYARIVRLEVAAHETVVAERLGTEIRESSIANSIFKGRSLEVSLTPGVKDEYGNVDHVGQVKVDFRRAGAVSGDEIVLDPLVWPVIEHSLLNLQQNRAALLRCNVALKRGLLFYGPPGTGKSFTCRYVASSLPETTVVFSTGAALHHISSTFNLARMLKPALIVMEDVDLVFSSRDINLHGGALGDLFDQMDGLADDEPIAIILTTNAIERLEAAVKDRPGRVSQCVYFGPPSAELRKRYLLSYLRHHDAGGLDLERIVRETEGASQAFLKELVHRALQFCVEAGRFEGSRARPTSADFLAALNEIRAFDSKAARSITGFRVGQAS